MAAAEENKELVRRFYREVINQQRVDAIDELLSEDFVHNGEGRGREGQKPAVRMFLDAFPVSFESTAVLRVAGGQIAQAWDIVDIAGLMSELGPRPAAASPAASCRC